MYVDRDYAYSRLVNTLVRHNGEAVLVREVLGDLDCIVERLDTKNIHTVHLDDLELKSPPLGFVNFEGQCYYLTRKPMRNDWRQGVRRNSVSAIRNGREMSIPIQAISKCVDGKFPTRSSALASLRKGVREVAISRDYSLTRVGSSTIINYKWYGAVGKLTLKGIVLDAQWKYLHKELGGLA
jgi:hypothetical protein